VFGKIITSEQKEMLEECQRYGLTIVEVGSYLDRFEGLLNSIRDQVKGTNLDKLSFQKITTKLNRIMDIVKNSVKE